MTTTSLHGDNTLILPTLPRASVQCVVTSPPYYGLRDYGLPPTDWPEVTYAPMAGLDPVVIPAMSCCLGLEPTPAAYIGHLVYTWRLLAPVLRDDATCWLNLGDSYGRGERTKWAGDSQRGADDRKAWDGNYAQTQALLPNKQLVGIPWRAAFALQADGWYLRSDVIWAKSNPMPESVADRPTKAHEYIFLLAKSERYFYDADAVREPQSNNSHGGRPQKEIVTPRKLNNLQDTKTSTLGGVASDYNPAGRNRRTVWNVATQPYSGAHFAVMPEALIEPCVLASSRPGDVILDLYGGSGTVGKVAARLQRDCVLIDLNPDYIELQAERTDKVQIEMFV